MLAIILLAALLLAAFLLYLKFRTKDVLRMGRKGAVPCMTTSDGEDIEHLQGKVAGVKVKIDDFLERYLVGDCLPEDIVMELQLKRLAGDIYATVSQSLLKDANEKYHLYWQAETHREACVALEEKAIDLEARGKLEEAIALYEQNIAHGYPTYHSFDRLIAVYKERGDLEKEIAVLEKAVTAFGSEHPILRDICQFKLDHAQKLQQENNKQ